MSWNLRLPMTWLLATRSSGNQNSDLVTYQSGGHSSQIDYILLRRGNMKLTKTVKVINGEECMTQHRILACDSSLKFAPPQCRQNVPKLNTWKLRDQVHRSEFVFEMDTALQAARNPCRYSRGNLAETQVMPSQLRGRYVAGRRRGHQGNRPGGRMMKSVLQHRLGLRMAVGCKPCAWTSNTHHLEGGKGCNKEIQEWQSRTLDHRAL